MSNSTISKKCIGAVEVGKYFIYLSAKVGTPITNKKLQKLLYYSQAWSLVLRDAKLFNEPIEAWVHGPAVRCVYSRYKSFGYEPITEKVTAEKLTIKDKDVLSILDDVWKVYGYHDAAYLEFLSHSEAPWQEARQGVPGGDSSSNVISDASMRKFYSQKMQESA